jgi:flagellar basal-body rod modification protein FlgD
MISPLSNNSTPVSGTNSSSQTTDSSSRSGQAGVDRLANTDVFLQLLVAQIKNQNPLNPSDGTQFLTQLAQFSQLEQTMDSRKELEAIHQILGQGSASPDPAQSTADPNTAATGSTSTDTGATDATTSNPFTPNSVAAGAKI